MLVAAGIIFLLPSIVSSQFCPKNSYLSSEEGHCRECSECVHPEIVIRPCQIAKDTICGPLSALDIDWSWLIHGKKHDKTKKDRPKEMVETFHENLKEIKLHEKHVREKEKLLKEYKIHMCNVDHKSQEEDDILWEQLKDHKHEEFPKKKNHKKHKKHKHKKKKLDDSDEVSDDLTALEKQRYPDKSSRDRKWHQNALDMAFDFGLGDHKIHFDDEEAMKLLKSSKRKFHKKGAEDNLNRNMIDKDVKEEIINEPVSSSEDHANQTRYRKLGYHAFNSDRYKFEEKGNTLDLNLKAKNDIIRQPQNFTSTESLFLDWQTIILALAVSSCLLFFIVAAIYSLQHASERNKLRKYFETEVEELQCWLNTKDHKSHHPNSGIYKATTEVVHKEGGQCKYLERIISMKGKKKFNRVPENIYEGTRTSEMKTLRNDLTSVHRSKV